MTSRRDILHRLIAIASPLYGEEEARQIAEMIVCAKGGITRGELLTEPACELEVEGLDRIESELAAWRPVQYITGSAEFCGLDIAVREGVLIPRPETEELVDLIRREVRADARLLDVGTGSGCIAVALASMLPAAEVWGLDISAEALAVAAENCRLHAPRVRLVEGDALGNFATLFDCRFDAIVSNPPYIPRSDRSSMRANVICHEPHMALFVDDDDPLVFYRS
ncbi:MAG: peptide chain release factor N(5)-glutamine methyltransferase, partial [Alistipes sp.]|nr:peptide chain release factor N(5)-glutamine methyltransferase [Alistipes sp.]